MLGITSAATIMSASATLALLLVAKMCGASMRATVGPEELP
ncbi:hypothetical protein [uncultured Sulfitobacter sp.]|nr:hypothetical protein [uncultured Sulfitobacter sp.]